MKALLVVIVLGMIAVPGSGRAEKVKTNQATKLYSHAGEQAPVLLKVQSGKTMTVLAKDGRWIKVRVSGRTGWVPRSKVDLPEGDDEVARNTRRRPFVDGRSTRRGFGGTGGPDDRVGADAVGEGADPKDADDRTANNDKDDPDVKVGVKIGVGKAGKPDKIAVKVGKKPAKGGDEEVVSVDDDDDTAPEGAQGGDGGGGDVESAPPARPMAHVAKATRVYAKPDKESDEAFTADPKVALFVGKTKGDWTKVSTDDGDAGYVLSSKLELDDTGGGGDRVRMIDARGRLGITLVKQSLSTPGGMLVVPDNYAASSSSLTIALGGSALYPYKERYWVGGELGYDYDKAVPGINYMNSTTSFSYHVLNLRAVGGYDLQTANGMTVYARIGLHYDSFQVSDVADFTKNTAKLPSQIIAAPLLGGGLGIARLTPKLALLATLDFMPAGSVSQTKNLEDGTGPGAKGFFLGGRLTYHWKPKMDLQFTYDLSYESISFSGMPPATSMRGHTGTGVSSGSDFNNAVSGGISYTF
ncbi:MAG TPA: SH3 domain-containing protein [Kofleriaceae bacterium]|nr:SH3 domain-containing protein [Kofleriaceae bacterium]